MSNSSRPLMANSKRYDGVEAPRSSLDLSLEAAKRHHALNESLMVKQQPSRMSFHRSGTPAKMAVNEEAHNLETIKRGGPSVVARLMGMDTSPPKKSQAIKTKECADVNPRKNIPRVPRFVSAKSELNSPSPAAIFTRFKERSPPKHDKQHSSPSAKSPSSVKPLRREHPQEDLLRNFKKEFESWQAAKVCEFSGNDGSQGSKSEQILASDNLTMEKAQRFPNANRFLAQKKPVETEINKVKPSPKQIDGLYPDDTIQEKRSRSCSPTRIVILKPSTDVSEIEEVKSSNMDHFLEEVKERLRMEMEGKGKNDSGRRRSTDQTLPESAKKEARKFISDRLKNVLKDESEMNGKERSSSIAGFSKEGKGARFWEDKKAVNESIPKYIRREHMQMDELDFDSMSPIRIIRSFSTPNSGSSFDKLMFEDQIRRKLEIFQNDSSVINRNKKDGFNFKGRVSNLRRNLSFKGKIFGKKVSSSEESTSEKSNYGKHTVKMPPMIRNMRMVEDNSTEVPPTPASFSDSPTSEIHGPISSLEVPFLEDSYSEQLSSETGAILRDSENEPQQEEISSEQASEARHNGIKEPLQIESLAKSYIRGILLLSGLYISCPLDQALSRLDGHTQPISSRVFDKLEDTFRVPGKPDCALCEIGDITVDRKMLFDLVNESLPSTLGSPKNPLTSKSWRQSLTELPCGTQLLDDLLNKIQIYINPITDRAHLVNKVVAWDARLRSWQASSYDDVCFVEKQVEEAITGELVDELVLDLLFFGITT